MPKPPKSERQRCANRTEARTEETRYSREGSAPGRGATVIRHCRMILLVRANSTCRRLSMLFRAEYHSYSEAQREEREWRKNGTSAVGIQGLAREQGNFTAVLKLDLVPIAISRRSHGNTRTGRTDSKNVNIQGMIRRRARDCRATLCGRVIRH
jgi:hypothetical protein